MIYNQIVTWTAFAILAMFFIKTGERANKVDEKMANLRREWANAWADMLAGSQQIPADRRC